MYVKLNDIGFISSLLIFKEFIPQYFDTSTDRNLFAKFYVLADMKFF